MKEEKEGQQMFSESSFQQGRKVVEIIHGEWRVLSPFRAGRDILSSKTDAKRALCRQSTRKLIFQNRDRPTLILQARRTRLQRSWVSSW